MVWDRAEGCQGCRGKWSKVLTKFRIQSWSSYKLCAEEFCFDGLSFVPCGFRVSPLTTQVDLEDCSFPHEFTGHVPWKLFVVTHASRTFDSVGAGINWEFP